MKRTTVVLSVALAAGAAAVSVVLAGAGNVAAGALGLALAVWILYATYLNRALGEATRERTIVVTAWVAKDKPGQSTAIARAQRIREHHRRQEAEAAQVHASGFPCGARRPMDPAHPSGKAVTCPICVSLTNPIVEAQP